LSNDISYTDKCTYKEIKDNNLEVPQGYVEPHAIKYYLFDSFQQFYFLKTSGCNEKYNPEQKESSHDKQKKE